MAADPGHAEVIPLSQGREAREARAAAAAERSGRPRCSATRVDGRPCRNHAVDAGRCHVHAPPQPRPSDAGESTHDPATEVGGDRDRAGGERARDDGDDLPDDAAPGSKGGRTGPSLAELLDGAASALLGELPLELPEGVAEGLAALRDLGADLLVDQLPELAAFLRRRLTGDYEVDVFGFDEDLTTNVLLPLLRPLHRVYWRVASQGAEHLPRSGGGLVVANHAGTLPADALVTRLDIFEATGRHARELGADLVFRTPVVGPLARKTGVTLASGDDADRLLSSGELVAVWPEGYKGLGKPWKDRYKLQRFGRGGFVATALRAQVPIVPTAIVGSEEIYPLLFDLRAVARTLRLPYFPIVAQMLALPVLGPFALLPLPSKWVIEYGEPIDTTAHGPGAADDPMVVFDLADQVRDRIQAMLHRNLLGRRSVFL